MFQQFRHYLLIILSLIATFLSESFAQDKKSAVASNLSIRLLVDQGGILLNNENQTDQTILIGVEVVIEKGWHFYWGGLAIERIEPTIAWTIPQGFKIIPLAHPQPKLFDYGGFEGYGYSGKSIFLYQLIIPKEALLNYNLGGQIEVKAQVETVLCKDQCILDSTPLLLEIPLVKDKSLLESSELLKNVLIPKNFLKSDALYNPKIGLEDFLLESGMLGWLCLGFIGGLILNLMPCVLPVLSIKLLSLIDQSSAKSSQRQVSGLLYASGVVFSFCLLAVGLFVLRLMGESVGWGFQLQNPYFIVCLISLFFLMGMNMLGVFEMGVSLTRFSGGKHVGNEPYRLNAFLTGVLAAFAGAPCIGPFIGAVSGIALQLNIMQGIFLFGSIGFGMAFPFLCIAYIPNLVNLLPKPGAWMETFRKLMGALILVSALYLIWVAIESAGNGAILILASLLLLLGLASWGYGKWGIISEPPKVRKLAKWGASIMVFLSTFFAGAFLTQQYNQEKVLGKEFSQSDARQLGSLKSWEEWSELKVEKTLKSGQPAFIDFTASWCLICQRNKFFVLRKDKTEELYKEYNIQTFSADWTHSDSEISKSLDSYGRSGVPFYLLIMPDGEQYILPQILSYESLRATFQEAKLKWML